jgi:hypothetical protein
MATSSSSTPGTATSAASTKASRKATTPRKPASARRQTAASTSTSTQPKTRVEHAQQLAERAVLVPVGASLVARDNLVSSVKGFATKYSPRTGLGREIRRYERRGVTARNRFERQVRKTRTKFERELRQRRSRVERTVKQNRRRFEREVRSARRDLERQSGVVGARFEKLVANAQELLSSAV